MRKKENAFVVDVGTGTGCILLSLLKDHPGLKGVGVDISGKAIEVFRRNRAKLRLIDRAFGVLGDGLKPFAEEEIFDAVVSNPPYVKTEEIETLQDEIKLYEPKEALDGGRDGLDFIRRLVKEAYVRLKRGGFLTLEVGYEQAEAVSFLMKRAGFVNIEVERDLSQIERVVMGWKH